MEVSILDIVDMKIGDLMSFTRGLGRIGEGFGRAGAVAV